ncbi:MAG: glycosyltransferase family 4 protein [Acidobacteriota bacterium]|nr:glycosyltransferase family 4 protein [Acidobacteriota bacterium]
MRIALLNKSRRKAGGAEKYIDGIVPELCSQGHDLAFLHDVDTPDDRDGIFLPDSAPAWCIAEIGAERAISALRAWRPDVIYMQSSIDRKEIANAVAAIPTVFFCHDYVGTCISGHKSFQFPVMQPCSRRFGAPCLLHYYPRRCGGLNPVTMWNDYWKQSSRLNLLGMCKAIVTASEAMRDEYRKHGFNPETIHQVPLFASSGISDRISNFLDTTPTVQLGLDGPLRLLFAGRMDRLKGGEYFLDALPRADEALGCPLEITFAGDGPARPAWQRKAAEIASRSNYLKIEFPGWLAVPEIGARLQKCHLLVVPSVWPEPFGLVGVEAGLHGVPAAAFAVGGIESWLKDGVNGRAAPGDPPTPSGLAAAIVRCLDDPDTYARLRQGAYDVASQFTMKRHLDLLTKILAKAANG